MKKPLTINKLLASGTFSPLLARLRALAALEQQVQALLPVPLQPHCRVLALRDRLLVLAADSPVWAARLRFHAPKLAKQLARQQTAAQLKVRIRVIPPEKTSTSAGKRPAGRSQGQLRATSLQQVAQTISDPRLKSALLRLAGR